MVLSFIENTCTFTVRNKKFYLLEVYKYLRTRMYCGIFVDALPLWGLEIYVYVQSWFCWIIWLLCTTITTSSIYQVTLAVTFSTDQSATDLPNLEVLRTEHTLRDVVRMSNIFNCNCIWLDVHRLMPQYGMLLDV